MTFTKVKDLIDAYKLSKASIAAWKKLPSWPGLPVTQAKFDEYLRVHHPAVARKRGSVTEPADTSQAGDFARKLKAEADLAEIKRDREAIKLELERGSVIKVDEAESIYSRMFGELKMKIYSIARHAAEDLALIDSAVEVENVLNRNFDEVFAAVSRD